MGCEREKGLKGDLRVFGVITGRIKMTLTGRGVDRE